jgi:hypothetical protein
MEALARASLMIRDLAKGIKGEVVMDIDQYDSPRQLLAEIHEGQRELAMNGWTRSLSDAVLMPYNQNNVECGAWFRNRKLNGEWRTDWIRCTITTRFGLRAVFWNVDHLGEHQIPTRGT